MCNCVCKTFDGFIKLEKTLWVMMKWIILCLEEYKKIFFIRIRAFTLLNAIWYLYKERFM